MTGSSIPSFAVSRFSFQRGGITQIPQKLTPARPARRAEDWLRRTPIGLGSCLFQKRPAATRKRRQRFSAAPGHLQKWPPTLLAERSASLYLAIPNAPVRQRGGWPLRGKQPTLSWSHGSIWD